MHESGVVGDCLFAGSEQVDHVLKRGFSTEVHGPAAASAVKCSCGQHFAGPYSAPGIIAIAGWSVLTPRSRITRD
jgi:hypothetical protein